MQSSRGKLGYKLVRKMREYEIVSKIKKEKSWSNLQRIIVRLVSYLFKKIYIDFVGNIGLETSPNHFPLFLGFGSYKTDSASHFMILIK